MGNSIIFDKRGYRILAAGLEIGSAVYLLIQKGKAAHYTQKAGAVVHCPGTIRIRIYATVLYLVNIIRLQQFFQT